MKPWRRIKVVVEVPVLGEFSERDLVWSVKRALEADGFWQDRKYLPENARPVFGSVQVKEWNKIQAWFKRLDKMTEKI